MIHIYVYKCSDNKYYIEKTTLEGNIRFLQHLTEDNICTFTNNYPPIEIIEKYDTHDLLDEDKIIKKYMMIDGINNVRGGSYTSFKLEDWQIKSLEHEFVYVSNPCLKYNKQGHLPQDCVIDNELLLYLDSFDTLDKMNHEIIKITKIYNKISILQQKINNTNSFNIKMLNNVKNFALCINEKEIIDIKIQIEQQLAHKTNIKRKSNYLDIKLNDLLIKAKKIDEACGTNDSNPRTYYCGIWIASPLLTKIISSSISICSDSSKKLIFTNEENPKSSSNIFIVKENILIKFLQLVNYNLEQKKQLEQILEIYNSEDNIITKLAELYEKRVKMIM